MSATHGTFWFWTDWLGDPAVRRLTPAERGVWIDCLALMAVANPTGYLCDERGEAICHEEIARVVNATPKEVAELLKAILRKGVASRDRTGRLFNRRMVRKASIAAKNARNGKLGAAATRLKWLAVSGVPGRTPGRTPGRDFTTLTIQERKKEEIDEGNGKRPDELSKPELEAAHARRNGRAP